MRSTGWGRVVPGVTLMFSLAASCGSEGQLAASAPSAPATAVATTTAPLLPVLSDAPWCLECRANGGRCLENGDRVRPEYECSRPRSQFRVGQADMVVVDPSLCNDVCTGGARCMKSMNPAEPFFGCLEIRER